MPLDINRRPRPLSVRTPTDANQSVRLANDRKIHDSGNPSVPDDLDVTGVTHGFHGHLLTETLGLNASITGGNR